VKSKAINTEMAELSVLCKALAHPVRVQILQLLLERRCLCGDVVNALPLAQSTVSEHLKILKEAGLIHDEAEGPRRRYCVNHQLLRRFKALIAAL
jgi:ArsR family transcriptional regulator, arsenate/arsenite/antimonite-responsive transcriptional repressor